MIWTISSFDTAKSLEEPWGTWMKEIWYTSSELLKKDMEWMDIGLKKRTVSISILRRKIYLLICCNIFLVIIKCGHGNINRQTCIRTTCPSITKFAIEVIPRTKN